MIQKVEEAANTHVDKVPYNEVHEAPYTYLDKAFCAGAAWQREQGIEWISITEKFPIPPPRTCLIEVLVTNGRLWERRTYNDDAKIFGNGFLITHWAYINLPKTDK